MGVGSSLPDPSFPLRREILAQGGSLLVSVCLVWVVLATCFCGPHIPVCPGRSCMLFAGMMALAGAAVVDRAHSARRQSKGSGPGLVPLRTRPRSWGAGGVRGLPPLPCKESVGSSPWGPRCPGRLFWAVLCCPGLPSIVVAWVSAFRHCWCRCWCGVGGAAGVVAGAWCWGGGSILSGVSVAAGDVVSCGTGNQISLNLRVLTGLRPPLVTLSLRR